MNQIQDDDVKEFLTGIQLEQFYWHVRNKLHVTQLSHFDHVNEADLDDLGMAKPEQRRLFDALRKARKKSLFSSFRKKKSKKASSADEVPATKIGLSTFYGPVSNSLTCLINEQSLQLQEMLGNGAFGYVRKGVWNADQITKVDVAVKCLKYSTDEKFLQMQTAFIKEANAMTHLDHPNLVKLYGIVLSEPMMLVLELAPLGCLLFRLRNEPHNFLITSLCSYTVQIASGMAYLESQRFIHRDLAARNILMESYKKVKIGDFGMMRALSGDEQYFTMDPQSKVAFAWCAPESLKFRRFSHASDVWSFGITVMELFSYGDVPWPGYDGSEILAKVDQPACQRPKKPRDCPSQIYKLILSQCWAHEPCHRPTFSSLKRTLEELQPPVVKTLHKYDSKSPDNLCFMEGDKITLLDASSEKSWWFGQNMTTGKTGSFPAELVDSDMRPGLALSPPKSLSDQLKKMKSVKQSGSSRKVSLCDAKNHSYEYPVFLRSPDGEDNRIPSGHSKEGEFTSSGECDSGYSSSSDRYTRGSSLISRQTNNSASYENCEPMLYEEMIPCTSSKPIPIPGNAQRKCSEDASTPRNYNKQKSPLDTDWASPKIAPVQCFDPKLPPPLPARNSLPKTDSNRTGTAASQTQITSEKRPLSSVSQRGRSREHFYENHEIVSLHEVIKQDKVSIPQSRESQLSYENVSLAGSPKRESLVKQSSYENWEVEENGITSTDRVSNYDNESLPSYENVSLTQGKSFERSRFSFDLNDPVCGTEEYEIMMKPSLQQSCSKKTKTREISDVGTLLNTDLSNSSVSCAVAEEDKSSKSYENCFSFEEKVSPTSDEKQQQPKSLTLNVSKTKAYRKGNQLSQSAPSNIITSEAAGRSENDFELEHGQGVNYLNKHKSQHTSSYSCRKDLELHRFHSTSDVNNYLCGDLLKEHKFPVPPPRKNRPVTLNQTGRSQSDCTDLRFSKPEPQNMDRPETSKAHDNLALAGEYMKLKIMEGENHKLDFNEKAWNESDSSSKSNYQQAITTAGNELSQSQSGLSGFSNCSAMNESIAIEDVPVLPPKRGQDSECIVSRSNSWSSASCNGFTDNHNESMLPDPSCPSSCSKGNCHSSVLMKSSVPFSQSLPNGVTLIQCRQIAATLSYDSVPPPLPKKMSRSKSPAIPPRVDLGQG